MSQAVFFLKILVYGKLCLLFVDKSNLTIKKKHIIYENDIVNLCRLRQNSSNVKAYAT